MAIDNDKKTTFLARTNFRGMDKVFGIKARDRRQHMYVIGKTGTGKTVLLKNMALQDIRAGHGVGIIDPHGEFVEEVLSQIPPERAKDVVYFNPVDVDYPIGFNVLEVADPLYKHLGVSDLLGIFTKIWANVWSARMEYILQNCILALLDTPGTTLLGIPRILVDKDYREKIIANVKDPVVRSFWVHEYETWRDQFRSEAIVPIQNKVGQFLNTSFIRNIVGQAKSTLNIPQIMNEGKILLVNVSKGKIGEDNSGLLGAMIITKVQLAAMERVRIAEDERRDFYMYVDEFQNFATDSFASILSEARKYRLDLIIAHQYIGQLVTDTSTKVRDAVFGNVGTMLSFRIGAEDAEYMEKEFEPEFMPQDLVNLPNHHVYLKLMVNGVTSRPFSGVTLPPITFETDPGVREKIIETSRERYSRPRAEVEEQIARWAGMVSGDAPAGEADTGKYETICSNCGKNTTVPFKPDGKRPAYCLDCLRKIEAGTLIPLPDRMPQLGKSRFGDTLNALGIEFPNALSGTVPLQKLPGARQHRTELGHGPTGAGDARLTKRNFGSGIPRPGTPPPVSQRRFESNQRRGGQRNRRNMQPSAGNFGRPAPDVARVQQQGTTGTGDVHSTERNIGSGTGAQRSATSAPVRPISLSELKPRDQGENIKVRPGRTAPRSIRAAGAEVDISGLRKTLEAALRERTGEKTAPENKPEGKPEGKKEGNNVIRPGGAVRF